MPRSRAVLSFSCAALALLAGFPVPASGSPEGTSSRTVLSEQLRSDTLLVRSFGTGSVRLVPADGGAAADRRILGFLPSPGLTADLRRQSTADAGAVWAGLERSAGIALEEAIVAASGGDPFAEFDNVVTGGFDDYAEPIVGWLEFVDGQRLPGAQSINLDPGVSTAADEATDGVAWEHPGFGRLVVPYDRIARIVRYDESSPVASSGSTDAVQLRSGDVYEGFVERAYSVVECSTDLGVARFFSQDVSSITFSNPSEPMRGLCVWLMDGTVLVDVSVDRVQVAREVAVEPAPQTVASPMVDDPMGMQAGAFAFGAGLGPGPAAGASGGGAGEPAEPKTVFVEGVRLTVGTGESVEYPLDEVLAVGYQMERTVSLLGLDPVSETIAGNRYHVAPVAKLEGSDLQKHFLAAPDFVIDGPRRIEWAVPEGATVFSARAVLDSSLLPWADCELRIELDGKVVQRVRFGVGGDTDARLWTSTVGASRIAIELRDTGNGPINDRPTLRWPMFLLSSGS